MVAQANLLTKQNLLVNYDLFIKLLFFTKFAWSKNKKYNIMYSCGLSNCEPYTSLSTKCACMLC